MDDCTFPPLAAFGPRIMICGPSNSGKSTLAVALATKIGIPAVHLDQLHHLPNTDWVPRPYEEFAALHDAAIAADSWVMEGNYSRLFPPRLARATGIILLGDNRWANFGRYIRRTLFQRDRPGALPGARDSLKWDMVRWILVSSPSSLRSYRAELPNAGLPFVRLDGFRDLNRSYMAWALQRSR